jgi:hypothetical protein
VAKLGILVKAAHEQSYPWDWQAVEDFLQKGLDNV